MKKEYKLENWKMAYAAGILIGECEKKEYSSLHREVCHTVGVYLLNGAGGE